MRPQRILLFFICLLACLSLIAVFFDGTTITIGKHTLFRFPSLEKKSVHMDSMNLAQDPFKANDTFTDTTEYVSLVVDSTRWFPKTLHGVDSRRIELPSLDYLNPFFESLDSNHLASQVVRILYYGDSQIEGDRITSSLRHHLQSVFGGLGPGLIPWQSKVKFGSYDFDIASSWSKRHVLSDPTDSTLGLYMGYYTGQGTMQFNPSKYYPYRERQCFSRVSLLGYNMDGFSLIADNKPLHAIERNRRSGIECHHYSCSETSKQLSLKSDKSSQCFALFLDGDGGIACDNLPLRGSSGYVFAHLNPTEIQAMVELTHTRLIILQFGVNAVTSTLERMPNFKAIEARLCKELKALKNAVPGTPIVVISISDRALKQGNEIISNPNAKIMRDVQRRACRKVSCAFWDLYEAMGGEGAIKDWVTSNFAGKDYVHFTPKGAERVGQMIYKSLIEDYIYFLHRSKSATTDGPEIQI